MNGNTFKKFFLLPILMLTSVVNGLKLTKMITPVLVDFRQPILLDCEFDMEGDELYSVKWYKDSLEFFRYTPNETPNTKYFPLMDLHLMHSKTDCNRKHCKIELRYFKMHKSSALYGCEIIGDAPLFHHAIELQNVTVAILPLEDLKIEGLQNAYNEGDTLEANCSSSPSDPAPILTWYINDNQAPTDLLGDEKIWFLDGLEAHSISIRFLIHRKYFREDSNVIQLQCISTLPGLPVEPQMTTKSITVNSSKIINSENFNYLLNY